MEIVFQLSSLLVMPFWLLIIFLPHWQWTRRVMASPWIAAPAALLYTLLVVPSLASLLPQLANPQLGAISALLGTPAGATIAWVHFLAFDLFVGRWAYLDSRQRGTSAWIVSPVLFLILMVGPLGLLLYLFVRLLPARTGQPVPAIITL